MYSIVVRWGAHVVHNVALRACIPALALGLAVVTAGDAVGVQAGSAPSAGGLAHILPYILLLLALVMGAPPILVHNVSDVACRLRCIRPTAVIEHKQHVTVRLHNHSTLEAQSSLRILIPTSFPD